MGGDDYISDLDAVNIFSTRENTGSNIKDAFCLYYFDIEKNAISRAEEYVKYKSLSYIRNCIYSELWVNSNSELLALENGKGYAAYNFIRNIENENNYFVEYVVYNE